MTPFPPSFVMFPFLSNKIRLAHFKYFCLFFPLLSPEFVTLLQLELTLATLFLSNQIQIQIRYCLEGFIIYLLPGIVRNLKKCTWVIFFFNCGIQFAAPLWEVYCNPLSSS